MVLVTIVQLLPAHTALHVCSLVPHTKPVCICLVHMQLLPAFVRPDMMKVEMTAQEQRQYLQCAATHAAGMADLTTHMPNGRAKRIWIVEGGYCWDTRYKEKLEEKGSTYCTGGSVEGARI